MPHYRRRSPSPTPILCWVTVEVLLVLRNGKQTDDKQSGGYITDFPRDLIRGGTVYHNRISIRAFVKMVSHEMKIDDEIVDNVDVERAVSLSQSILYHVGS